MKEVEIIKDNLINNGGKIELPLLKGNRYFNVELEEDGVYVDNLHKQPFLHWSVFEKTIELLKIEGGDAIKGSAMAGKLGDDKLPIDSIEGYVAQEVYGKQIGESVFRRSTPIANILIWAGVCEGRKGALELKQV